MPTRDLRRECLAVAMLSTALCGHAGVSTPDLGEPLSAGHVAAVDLTIMPDGRGLPAGSGSVAAGAEIFASHCRSCHGAEGRGGLNDVLAGGMGTLTSAAPLRTIGSYWPHATTVFDYIRRAMPYQQPGVLSADEVYAVTAFLLHRNGIVDADAVMTAETLPRVVMPNRDGFLPQSPVSEPQP